VWAEIFLGVIALATFTMAAIHVGVIVYGLSVVRRLDRLLSRVDDHVEPLAESLNAIVRDAARISALVTGQAERIDRVVTDLTSRVEQNAMAVHVVLEPLRHGAAAISAVKAAMIEVFRPLPRRSGANRAGAEDDDALFIG
jgi:hypothetical protein